MAKKKKKNNSIIYLCVGAVILVFVIVLLVYYSSTEMNRSMQEDGYTTENSSDPFYKKITTGNTLDDYYNDLASNKDTAYEEYYLSKESYNFIEQKLFYQSGVTSALNIRSDLRDLYTVFNYELSYQEAYILLEGNSENDFECEVVTNKNASRETLQSACDRVQEELEVFFYRRNEIIANEKVQEMLEKAPAIVPSNNYEE